MSFLRTLLFTAATLSASALFATDYSIEAEKFIIASGSWALKSDSGASGGKSIYLTGTANTGELTAVYDLPAGEFVFEATVRVSKLEHNTFAFSVDGGAKQEWTLPKTGYTTLSWSTHFTFAAPGKHTVHIWGREKGTLLDKFTLAGPINAPPPPPDPDPTPDPTPDPVPTGDVVHYSGTYTAQLRIDSPGSKILDLAKVVARADQNHYGLNTVWPDPVTFGHKSEVDHTLWPMCENIYPLTIKGKSDGYTVWGGIVVGDFDPVAPWHIWKGLADGDGIRAEGLGSFTIASARIHNVEDGISPHTSTDNASDKVTCYVRDVYASRIQDDCIENDSVHSMVVSNSYFSGHTFYSADGSGETAPVVTFTNCVVELMLLPHQGRISGTSGDLNINTQGGYPYPDGLGCGCLFKLSDPSRETHCKDCVFLVNRHSTSSNGAMSLRGATFENCTLVWLGDGDYPAEIPNGLTLTRDTAAFDRAKAAFFANHPQYTEGSLANRTQPLP